MKNAAGFLKRAAAAFIALLSLVFFSGCDILSADSEDLLKTPMMSGEAKAIGEALKVGIKESFTLKYPSVGDYRSAIVLFDIDGDTVKEAFAFYSTVKDNVTSMHIALLKKENAGWIFESEQKTAAAGIEKVSFADLDENGVYEILTGWSLFGTVSRQLTVYTVKDSKLNLTLSEPYVGYRVCDMDDDFKQDIFIVDSDNNTGFSSAKLYKFTENGALETGKCSLDGALSSASHINLSRLTSGKTALLVDLVKGTGFITEIVYLDKGVLTVPFFNSDTGEKNPTFRQSELFCSDIDSDGFFDIPVISPLPFAFGEQLSLISWSAFSGQAFESREECILDPESRELIYLPDNLINGVAVSFVQRDHEIFFNLYNAETEEYGEEIFKIKAMLISKYEADGLDKSYTKLCTSDKYVYAVKISEEGIKDGITVDGLLSSVKVKSQAEK